MTATMTRQQIEFRNHLVEAHQADLAGLDQAGLERLHRSLHEQMLIETGSAFHRSAR